MLKKFFFIIVSIAAIFAAIGGITYVKRESVVLPQILEQSMLNFALKEEETTTKTRILKAFPERKFVLIDNGWNKFIVSQTFKYPLTLKQKLQVSKYAVRVLVSLDPGDYVSNSLDQIGNYSPFLNVIHPHETQALDSSREYILKGGRSIFGINNPEQKDIELILESAIAKEAYKFQLPIETKQSAIRLLQALDSTYRYQKERLDDPLNDLVVVKMGPRLFSNDKGGGTINLDEISGTKEELGLVILHEKLHVRASDLFYQKHPSLTDDQIDSALDRDLQEISVTALQYLLAKKIGLPISSLEEDDYWQGARDLLVILAELKQNNLFDWEKQKNDFLLMAAEGNFKPIFQQYSQISKIPVNSLESHFDRLREKFFQSSDQEIYFQTIDTFNQESEQLGFTKKWSSLFSI